MWEDVTTSVDTENDVICGSVTSFSLFLLAESVEELLQQILDDVLAMSGLSGNVAGSLASKLENAIAKLDKDNVNAAINQLQAFINQVEALIQAGTLAQVDGELLIDVAQGVIDELSS